MFNRVRDNLGKFVNKGDVLVVGVSGGVDSVVLFDCLVELKELMQFEVVMAHLNHGLRGRDSDGDQLFVQELASRHELKFFTTTVDVGAMDGSVEMNGRQVRYDFFEQIRREVNGDWILTAHHANDSLESVLMNMARGCAVKGLCGIELRRGALLRPLVTVTKEEILEFAKERGLEYRVDKTNEDEKYQRNLVRHSVVPELKKLNPELEKAFLRGQRLWQEQYRQRMEVAKLWLNGDERWSVKGFSDLDFLLQSDVVAYLYEEAYGSTFGLSSAQVDKVVEIILSNRTGSMVELGVKFWICVEYDEFFLKKSDSEDGMSFDEKVRINGEVKFGEYVVRSGVKDVDGFMESSGSVVIDMDCLENGELFCRNWRDGDRFRPLNLKGTKKLQDFFVDKKVPADTRRKLPVFVDSRDRIVAVGNLAVADDFKVGPDTQNMLEIFVIP